MHRSRCFCKSKKSFGKNLTPKEIIDKALGELYCPDLPTLAMINHCLEAMYEIINTPEFNESSNVKFLTIINNLLRAPYKHFQGKLYPDMGDVVNFDHIFYSYLEELISFITLTQIGWSEQYKEYCKSKMTP